MSLTRRWAIGSIVGWGIAKVASAGADTHREHRFDPARAFISKLPWQEPNESVNARHCKFMHECCDCGLTHAVLVVEEGDGVTLAWWRDTRETTKRRSVKTFMEAKE